MDGTIQPNTLPPAKWGWLLAGGIAMIFFGFVAISTPLITALAVEVLVGSLFLVGGIAQFIQAWRLREETGFWPFIGAVLTAGLGLLLLSYPLSGVLTLTLVIGTYFFASGLLRMVAAINVWHLPGAGWVLFSGAISTLLGGLIWTGWPGNSVGIIGLLVGIDFIFSGASWVSLALLARGIRKELKRHAGTHHAVPAH
jgi:uncharacterized membrane protein HdeD (DUF308 family)